MPLSIHYALTLHDRQGTRLLHFDNAYAVKPPKCKRYAGWHLAFELRHHHRHACDKGVPYKVTSPQQLLEGFFNEVDRVLLASK